MKAMIFAAGLGTRLKPITDSIPKALVKLNGKPILEYVINNLIQAGVSEIIINVHYLGNQIIEYLNQKNNFGIRIEISDESEQILDTGGGLIKASWFFDDNQPFIVHNVDVISNINLSEMLNFHAKNNAIATLAVRKRNTSRYFLFDNNNKLCGWKNTSTNKKIISRPSDLLHQFAFSGIHILSPEIFNLINLSGSFSIVNFYLELAKTHSIMGYNHNEGYWFDIGNIKKLQQAEDFLKLK